VHLTFTLDQPAHVYLYTLDETGSADLVFPNASLDAPLNAPLNAPLPARPFSAGLPHTLPDETWQQAHRTLLACPLPGQLKTTETLYLVAFSLTGRNQPASNATGGPSALAFDEKAPGIPRAPLTSEALVHFVNRQRQAGHPVADARASYIIQATPGQRSRCHP
jgi:hypothetical protein